MAQMLHLYWPSMIYENEHREYEECGCNTFDGLGCNVLYTICEVDEQDGNFHEVAQNAIEGATATVRGSMDQVAMTGHVGCRVPITEDGIREHHLAPSMLD